MKMVVVRWDDIYTKSGWHPIDEADKSYGCPCETMGWLVTESDRYIIVAGSIGSLDSTDDKPNLAGDITTIPKSVVRDIMELEVKPKETEQ